MKQKVLQIGLIIIIFTIWVLVFIFIKVTKNSNISDVEKDYQKSLKYITNQSGVKHFPEKIPEDAQNITIYKNAGYFAFEP